MEEDLKTMEVMNWRVKSAQGCRERERGKIGKQKETIKYSFNLSASFAMFCSKRHNFLEIDGMYGGRPEDDENQELEDKYKQRRMV